MDYQNADDAYYQQTIQYMDIAPSHRQQAGRAMPPQQPMRSQEKVAKVERMSKADALSFVAACKKWLVVGSVVGFGVLAGLAANNVVGVTSHSTTPAAPTNSNGNTNPSAGTSSDDGGGGFFQQQQGGFGFGNSQSQQGPVSSSRTS